jgi:hypothetical protein
MGMGEAEDKAPADALVGTPVVQAASLEHEKKLAAYLQL